MKLSRMAFVVVFLGTPPTMAEPYDLMGAGAISCAEFGKQYAQTPTQTESFYFSWAQGYMSGYNMARPGKIVANLSGTSTEAQELAIRRFCDSHPLASYQDAVTSVYRTLPAK